MGLFRKKRAEVIRRGIGDTAVEERTTRRVGSSVVEVKRVLKPSPQPEKRERGRRGRAARPTTREAPVTAPVTPRPTTERKQMLVRRTPHQTQIVVLEGPLLVEHYVARSDRPSLTHNVYLGKVRNVLPGMEAAFVDFGEAKNGVLYAGDLQANGKNGRKKPRIEQTLKVGDEVLVQAALIPLVQWTVDEAIRQVPAADWRRESAAILGLQLWSLWDSDTPLAGWRRACRHPRPRRRLRWTPTQGLSAESTAPHRSWIGNYCCER